MAENVRRERQLGHVTANQQRYEAPRTEDIVDAIERQVCPFCGAGPFTVLATHVNAMHGITRLELREMAGLTIHDSICDATHSASRSTLSKQISAETQEVRTNKMQETWRSKTSGRDAAIVEMAADGQTSFAEIAAALDVPYITVMHVARRFDLHRTWGVGTDRVCEYCGERFRAPKPSSKQRFCDRTCANRHTTSVAGAPSHRPGWRPAQRRTESETRTCATCGTDFVVDFPNSSPKRYCSLQCRPKRPRASDGTFN